ncbi:Leucyl/phenylalanyl-tRNA--protein transferase [uncultured bacterium]|nr:Leucyl/phenylalanyl-tRNA--protein transferase [uncultured bacterium]
MSRNRIDQTDHFLKPDNMIKLYSMGAFPMARPEEPDIVEWFLPDDRTIIPIYRFNNPRSLRKFMETCDFEIRYDEDFEGVVQGCADRETTWISPKLIEAYRRILKLGYVHTVEVYQKNILVGGLYGISYRGAFFGESMFSRVPQASKVALVTLIHHLAEKGFLLLDVQLMTEHLRMFGAVEISSEEYNSLLKQSALIDPQF